MATAVQHIESRNTTDQVKDKAEFLPDIVEERRKDSDGRITVNKFSTGKLLGKGGFAKCYLGTHTTTNHQYALKIVAKSTLLKTKSKQKLQTEIKIHRVLRHTYVCKFERFFEDNHNVYMLLELCSNNSMSDLLKRRKKLTEPEVRYYLVQLISSLKYLHSNLVIHRDLKLGNLFLDSQMRIKVGDFGLATKIADVNERRKTFCGTPNYIAPEILQGKNGHSFEVDVWSTGVIVYTLLVGKPPFESKDVESTYKRILSNNFAFPDVQQPICEHAKGLIRSILQTKPSSRPKLDGILDHSFLTRSGTFTPTQLPESALREPPIFDSLGDKKLFSGFEAQYGDENDPLNVNRRKVPPAPRQKSFQADTKDKDTAGRPKMTYPVSGTQSGFEEVVKSLRETAAEAPKLAVQRTYSVPPSSSAATVLPGVTTRSASNVPPTGPLILSAPPSKKEKLGLTAAAVIDKRSYSSKFDIYQDSKTHLPDKAGIAPLLGAKSTVPENKVPHPSNYLLEKPRDPIPSSKGVGAHRTYEQGSNLRSAMTSSSSSVSAPRVDAASSEMDYLQTELEWFRLGSNVNGQIAAAAAVTAASQGTQPSTSIPISSRHQSRIADTEVAGSRRTTDAWSEDGYVSQHFAAPNPTTAQAYGSPNKVASERANLCDRGQPQPCSNSEPMQLSPPSDQIIALNEYKALGTLETMHEVLASKGLDDINLQATAFEAGPERKVFYRPQSLSHHKANIWVVRYVDYTSKYGLGFLLNTGSAGVYFNDSTKIVASPDGTVFQYSERRKKEKGSTSSEHSIQTHFMSKYPSELQKKVTLLRHFRNYLVDQQKEGASRGDDGSATGGREELENIAIVEGASLGANPSIPFGASSTTLRTSDAMQMGCCNSPSGPTDVDPEPKMPFLKKWVRTRHAILFRLSNRTVQVLFFDRSEVLLSSEARMVTYVSKQNVRSEHSLEEVLQTGRTDIAKRLKYAKDIMYRLISTQAS